MNQPLKFRGLKICLVSAFLLFLVSTAAIAQVLPRGIAVKNFVLQKPVIAKTGISSFAGVQVRGGTLPLSQLTASDAYGNGYIDFYGTTNLNVSNGIANITIDGIHNSSSTFTSGSLRLDLWALQGPYNGGQVNGYKTASIRTNQITGGSDTLSPGESFTNISLHLPYTAPGDASYDHYSLFLEMYDSSCTTTDQFCIIAAVNLQTQGGGGGGGGSGVLQPGVAVTGLSAPQGTYFLYTLAVPAGASNLYFSIAGGSGDADLYVRNGAPPTLTTYDCRPYLIGNGEACTFASPQAGTYYVMINAAEAFSGVTLLADYDSGGGGGGGNSVSAPSPDYSPCVRNATTSCLLNGRFRVQANWQSAPGGQGGATSVTYFGGGRAETDNAAVLYFQSPAFFEIGTTLYDGCLYGSSNTWVFISGLTDWSWAMTISDTLHRTYKQYYNPYHSVTQTTTDYYAFSCN